VTIASHTEAERVEAEQAGAGQAEAERAEALRRRYLADQVETASPDQRLLMLLGRLLHDLRSADAAFEAGDLKEVSDALVHAQEIVLVLRDTLRDNDWSGAASLRSVYAFLHRQLVAANLGKDRSLLPECVDMVTRITEANTRAAAANAGTVSVA